MKPIRRRWSIVAHRILTPKIATRPFITTNARASQKAVRNDYKPIDVKELLSKPTWSISSLLPSDIPSETETTPSITSKQLHHLLRLSALPPPASAAEEAEMLATLTAQLHFVREIQQVDTSGVEPLRSLRDETAAGQKDAEVGLENADIQEALAREGVKGRFHKRIRRRKESSAEDVATGTKDERWDVLRTATKKTGRYFVVEGGKGG